MGLGLGASLACDRHGDVGRLAPHVLAAEPSVPAAEHADAIAATDAEAPPILPTLSEAALAARYEAQKQVLGREGLFEDRRGQAVAPLLTTPSDADPSLAFDAELLDALPGSAGIDGNTGASGAMRANGNALGLFVPIAAAADVRPLAAFEAALRELEAARAAGTAGDRKLRIALYGASHTQGDVYPSYLRSYLQARFGGGGAGFVPLLRLNKWHTKGSFHIESSKHWQVEHAQTKDRRGDGFYGLLGATAWSSNKAAWVRISPSQPTDPNALGTRYDVHYLAQPGGGRFRLLIDGKVVDTISTRLKDKRALPRLGVHPVRLAEGPHSLEIRPVGDGEVRLFGVVIENDEPGVVVDTLGIAGTRAANQLRWDAGVWAASIAARAPDLVVLAYGTNEATDEEQPLEAYETGLRTVLTRLRETVPKASCLLTGPGDFPRQELEGVWTTRPRMLQIREAQKRIALEFGCGYWDAFAFMGGQNSMHVWATSNPQMASGDHIHLTKRGYVRYGMSLTDAIMAPYDEPQ